MASTCCLLHSGLHADTVGPCIDLSSGVEAAKSLPKEHVSGKQWNCSPSPSPLVPQGCVFLLLGLCEDEVCEAVTTSVKHHFDGFIELEGAGTPSGRATCLSLSFVCSDSCKQQLDLQGVGTHCSQDKAELEAAGLGNDGLHAGEDGAGAKPEGGDMAMCAVQRGPGAAGV